MYPPFFAAHSSLSSYIFIHRCSIGLAAPALPPGQRRRIVLTQAIPSRSDFSQGSISQAIFRQAGPMTVALLVNMLYSVVDRIYLGHIPGEGRLALTGIGLAFPIIAVISAFQRLCSDGGAPLCAMARGAGELERAETIQGNAYTLLLLFSLLLIALGYAFKAPILWATGAGEATFPYADAYLRIYLVGTIFVLPSLGMNAFITGQGFPTVSMMTVLLGAVVNILSDPLFIFVFDMGVQGAALATVIAQFTSFLWVLLFLTSHRAILRLRLNRMRLQRNIVLPMLGLGLTGFTMSVTNSAVGMVYNASLQTLGGDLYVGVMTVVNSIREIIYMPVSGLTAGAQPVISFNYGARCYSRTKEAIRLFTRYSFIYAGSVWALLMLLPQAFIGVFNGDAALLDAGVPALRIYYCLFFCMAFQIAGQHTFVAVGRSRHAIFFSLLRKVILVIPLVYLLPKLLPWGAIAVFLSEPISDLIGGTASYLAMRASVWKELCRLEALEPSHGPASDPV